MTERMNDKDWGELKMGVGKFHYYTSSLHVAIAEAERARREESQQQDRIHALEMQQAELLRQVKALKEALLLQAMTRYDGKSCWCSSARAGIGMPHEFRCSEARRVLGVEP